MFNGFENFETSETHHYLCEMETVTREDIANFRESLLDEVDALFGRRTWNPLLRSLLDRAVWSINWQELMETHCAEEEEEEIQPCEYPRIGVTE